MEFLPFGVRRVGLFYPDDGFCTLFLSIPMENLHFANLSYGIKIE